MMRTFVPRRPETTAARGGGYRPDYTLPLRMQAHGRRRSEHNWLQIQGAIWVRVLADRTILRRAVGLALVAGFLTAAWDAGLASRPGSETGLRVAGMAHLVFATAWLSGAAALAQASLAKRMCSNN